VQETPHLDATSLSLYFFDIMYVRHISADLRDMDAVLAWDEPVAEVSDCRRRGYSQESAGSHVSFQ
jgi:hypothetical protein